MSVEHAMTVLFNAGIAVSIIATVLSMGMSFTVAQVLAPLRQWVLVVAMVVVNCVVIPAAAWGIFTAFGISGAGVEGATLAVMGAAGAAGLKAAQISKRADRPVAIVVILVASRWAGKLRRLPRPVVPRPRSSNTAEPDGVFVGHAQRPFIPIGRCGYGRPKR